MYRAYAPILPSPTQPHAKMCATKANTSRICKRVTNDRDVYLIKSPSSEAMKSRFDEENNYAQNDQSVSCCFQDVHSAALLSTS